MMQLSEIAKELNTPHVGIDAVITSVGTDSRNIEPGQLFVAIKGDHFDGNEYAQDAIAKGASAALISNRTINVQPSVLVPDTRLALGRLAHYWRNRFTCSIVAVTGSNGKTTVKEMIAAIMLAANANVLATKGNLNNDIGVPLTLLNMRGQHTCAVIEMGMNHLGEISYLSKIAKPQVAVITNAGTAHIGELGSRQAIAQAKGEIFDGLDEDGIAVINANDEYADYWQSLNINRKVITFGIDVNADVSASYVVQSDEMDIKLTTPNGSVELQLPLQGKHNVMNVLAASAVAVALGVSNAAIVNGLTRFSGVQGRLNRLAGQNNAIVIDDTYNANPDSMKAAIDVLTAEDAKSKNKLIMVMGDMAELGESAESLHKEIGHYARERGVNRLLGFGSLSQLATQAFGDQGEHFDSIESLITATQAQMQPNTIVLVKGSRMMKMERVVDAIKANQEVGVNNNVT
jgi:UDP-N-acetylmuramoyl-tripeptide--D-alanyl-D-alanine ligase